MSHEQNKPVQLRTGNVITLGDSQEQEGKAVWPVNMDILTGVPLFNSDMGGENGWFVIDLDTVVFHKPRLTMDYNHNESEIIGYVEDFRRDESGLHATGYLVPFEEKDRANEVIYKNKNGVPYEVSPTVLPYAAEVEDLSDGETAVVNGEEQIGPIRIYRKLPVRGAAICPYGTDRHTSATVLSEKGTVMAKAPAKGKLNEDKVDKIIDEAVITPPIDKETLNDEEGGTAAHPDLEEFIAEFGFEQGTNYFREGMTFEDAQKMEYAELKAAKMAKLQEGDETIEPPAPNAEPLKKDAPEAAALKAEIKKLGDQVNRLTRSIPRGEREPVSTGEPEKKAKPDNRPAVFKLADKYAKKS